MTNRPLILPPLRRTAKDAEAFARVVHEGQFDKAARPYIEHVERVANGVWQTMVRECGFDPFCPEVDEARQVAWLHDTVEPDRRPYGPVRSDELLRESFALRIVTRVEVLCYEFPGRSYRTKIDWVIEQAINLDDLGLLLVKIADIEDNSDPERLALLDEPTRERLAAKYGAALPILKDAAARLGWRKGNE